MIEAPVPYVGSKRLWTKELEAIAQKLPKGAKVLDAYGGSGLVSHTLKQARPDLQVWCNDSDGYHSEILPQADKVRAWWQRWHDREPTQDNQDKATAALAKTLGNAALADKIATNLINLAQGRTYSNGHLMRETYPEPADNYCQGVRFLKRFWGPQAPIPTGYALLVLDPPYNTVKALNSTYYGTRRDDPPLSLWAAQQAFKSKARRYAGGAMVG